MYWNHRVFKQRDYDYRDEVVYAYSIRECYYNDENEIIGWTANGIDPYGENLEHLRETITWMLESLDKDVLEINPEDDNLLVGVDLGRAYDPEEPTTTYESIEALMEDLNSDDSESGHS